MLSYEVLKFYRLQSVLIVIYNCWVGSVKIRYTKELVGQLKVLMAEGTVFGSPYADVQSLVEALRDWGHEIEGYENDAASKPLLASRPWAVFTLRRTPPTLYSPQAKDEPVLRLPYVWMVDHLSGEHFALLVLIADKSNTDDEKQWYTDLAGLVQQAVEMWRKQYPDHAVLSHYVIEKGEES